MHVPTNQSNHANGLLKVQNGCAADSQFSEKVANKCAGQPN
jgi:hypothetical protein